MHHLIIGALQKGGIDGGERLHALRGQPGGKGHRMLFGDAHVEAALRKSGGEFVDARTARHRAGNRANALVRRGFGDQRIGKDIGVGGRAAALALVLLAGHDVEFGHAVIFVGGRFGGAIALALLRHDMDQDRPFFRIAHVLEHRDEVVQIMAVDRADIIEAQLLEQRAAGHHAARIFLRAGKPLVDAAGQLGTHLLGQAAQPKIFAAGNQPRQIGAKPADGRGDRHVIVVQDHNQPVARLRGVVHRLISHARAHRAIADHRDRLVRPLAELVGHGKAECGGDRGRAVRRPERIIFALGALGETTKAAGLTQRADTVPASGQNLVRIALMADIEDQPVVRRVEHIMDRRGQLDHAEPRPQMAAGDGYRIDHFRAQFITKLPQLVGLELAQVGGDIDHIEKRCFRPHCQCFFSHLSTLYAWIVQVDWRRSIAGGACSMHFNHGTIGGEAVGGGGIAHAIGNAIIVDMRHFAASIADHEDTVMHTARVAVGHIGIGAFHALGQIGFHEQIEDPIHAVGRNPLFPPRGYLFGNVIGGRRRLERGEHVENQRAHVGPLLAGSFQCGLRLLCQRGAMMLVMRMACHASGCRQAREAGQCCKLTPGERRGRAACASPATNPQWVARKFRSWPSARMDTPMMV